MSRVLDGAIRLAALCGGIVLVAHSEAHHGHLPLWFPGQQAVGWVLIDWFEHRLIYDWQFDGI